MSDAMGKLTRGALWVGFWPAGAVASLRAGKRKDTDRIVAAIQGPPQPRPPSAPRSSGPSARELKRVRKNARKAGDKAAGF